MSKSFAILLAVFVTYVASKNLYHIPLQRNSKAPSASDFLSADAFFMTNAEEDFYHIEDLINNMNTQLYGTVSIGNPAQNFSIIFDSGSSNFWVPGPQCNTSMVIFYPDNSSTYEAQDGSIHIQYGSGAMNGVLGSDTVTVAGITIDNVVFAQATELIDMPAGGFDGIIGMAFPEISANGAPTFLEQLANSGLIADTSYSFYIGSEESAIILGGIDETFANGTFEYFPILGDGYWTVAAPNLTVGEYSFNVSGGFTIMFDSGTSRIVVPLALYKDILEITGVQANVPYTLDILDDLPPITVNLGSGNVIISPSSYMMCIDDEYCILGLQGGNLPMKNFIILGDIFLKSYYTHFDYANMRIGFAQPAIL